MNVELLVWQHSGLYKLSPSSSRDRRAMHTEVRWEYGIGSGKSTGQSRVQTSPMTSVDADDDVASDANYDAGVKTEARANAVEHGNDMTMKKTTSHGFYTISWNIFGCGEDVGCARHVTSCVLLFVPNTYLGRMA
jgi:hypothetical protein